MREKRAHATGAARRAHDRLGDRRGARVRVDPRRRHQHPADRRRRRARHVQPPPRRAARRRTPARSTCRCRRCRRRAPAFEIHNSPLSENGVARLRVRLQRPGAVAPRHLGSAVRRLHQRRAGDHRRVHRVGAREVGAAALARAAAAARARRAGARSRQRAAGAVPAARRRHQHAHRQLHDRGAVLPPAAPPGGAAARPIRCRSSC